MYVTKKSRPKQTRPLRKDGLVASNCTILFVVQRRFSSVVFLDDLERLERRSFGRITGSRVPRFRNTAIA